MRDKVFLVCWDGDGGNLGGQTIPCGDRADVYGWGDGTGVGCPLRQTSDDMRRGQYRFISKLHNNKRRSLGPEW